METKEISLSYGKIKIDPTKSFQFLGVNDYGSPMDGDGTICPHCGAEGRYVYKWAEFGEIHAAMAGCYKALTGHIKMNDMDAFMKILSEKQAKNKPLNTWQKTVVRMNEFIEQGKFSPEWCESKIWEAVREQKRFAAQKWGGR